MSMQKFFLCTGLLVFSLNLFAQKFEKNVKIRGKLYGNSIYYGPFQKGSNNVKHGRYIHKDGKFIPAMYWWKVPRQDKDKMFKDYRGDYLILVGEWKNNKPIGEFLIYTETKYSSDDSLDISSIDTKLQFGDKKNKPSYYLHKDVFAIGKTPPWIKKHLVPSKGFYEK